MSSKAITPSDPPELKHANPILFGSSYVSCLILGCAGSGKTRLLCHILPQIRSDRVIICTSCHNNPFHLDIQKWAERVGKEFAICHNAQAYLDTMQYLFENDLASLASPSCVVFDDWLGDAESNKAFSLSLARYRYRGVSHITIAQSPQSIPPKDRNNINCVIMFNTNSVHCRRIFTGDFSDMDNMNGNEAVLNSLLSHVNDEKYTYAFKTSSPFCLGAGVGGVQIPLIKGNKLAVPSVRDILRLTNTRDIKQLAAKAKEIQTQMGNGASTDW